MAFIGSGVEYALHCLLWIVGPHADPASGRDLADLQGISPTFVAKLFPKLERAGIVESTGGLRGGYRLARPADAITVLDVVRAIDGDKPLFDCQEIRGRCAVFAEDPPKWSTSGTCAIHAVMLEAEQTLRARLAATTLADIASTVARKAPAGFASEIHGWLASRATSRAQAPARRKHRGHAGKDGNG